ncbi:somatic embryogenesis receptor kinase 4 [Impatiens glandulifera]|uniref:somatic embryogenesis receptor kinase 4 n=1 Tax=Impatiens glandulifera TaxID=253017 RepID=UPI001FB10555|nr:somatic embryogenesis receptor kinase 4 [Impatiens glandulifera]
MGFSAFILSLLIVISTGYPSLVTSKNGELNSLMDLKLNLDPHNRFLTSWTVSGYPCDGSFEGVACNDMGQVANISLQGKGLTGKMSPAIAGLKHLTGLYLHFNSLTGEIPKELSNLTELVDLYLNVNSFSGHIPPELGNMPALQVLQLCYNQISGSIPTELSSLKKLSVLALQSNQLTGAIPASLGDSETLIRLDLSFNHLFGSIPAKLAEAPNLQVFDVRNNTLSGNVPPGLNRLLQGFQFKNNLALCGVGFPSLRSCRDLDHTNLIEPKTDIPETANVNLNCSQTYCSKSSKSRRGYYAVGIILVSIVSTVMGFFLFSHYRRRKQKLGSSIDHFSNSVKTMNTTMVETTTQRRKNGSPLINLEYSNGWDPLADGRLSLHVFSQEAMKRYRFNLLEIETATQYFAEKNLLGKGKFSATFKGVLRDGSVVAIKSITKASCRSEEAEFANGLNLMTSLRHDNLVRFRGFCCSRGRGECFLIYDFIQNGSLLRYLDLKADDVRVLEWSARVAIVRGIAKGIEYLHTNSVNKPSLVHQNISAEKILIDHHTKKPLLADLGLHKLLTNDAVYSSLKARAAMGYLAPEYTNTGRFTEKSDIYAFGILVFQILSGKLQPGACSKRLHELIDGNLCGKYLENEAERIAEMALNCTRENPDERMSINEIVKELDSCCSCSSSAV